jgi:transcriptional regulator with XRE-family HTH domain
MDFKAASAKLQKMREAKDAHKKGESKSHDFAESYRLRGKMLGVLLRDARLSAERNIEECANLVRVSPVDYEAWEYGDLVPSLPQLELLAYYLGVPISHFWSTETLEARQGRHVDVQWEYLMLRNRMVGAMLRQAREEQNMTQEALSEVSAISVEQLSLYELGDVPIPMHELTVLAGTVKKNMSYFLESSGHFGALLNTREEWKHFSDLPDDLRHFAANPLNIGFIEIAYLLSQMPAERLRRIGESVLNITM